jgi:hypothetical protein
MKKSGLLILGLLTGVVSQAQSSLPDIPRCGNAIIWKMIEQQQPDIYEHYGKWENDKKDLAKPTGVVYRIPVVFHVVYYKNGNVIKGNIPDSAIKDQIKVLNEAYRKKHSDTGNVRAMFKPLSADAEIEFYLATKDPAGAVTSGITRAITPVDGYGSLGLITGSPGAIDSIEMVKDAAQGGMAPWPTNRYLNIWSADLRLYYNGQQIPALLGIATPPVNPLPNNWPNGTQNLGMKDGVVLDYHIVGRNNPTASELPAAFPNGKTGRTAVHEVGHYLGLRHIWGDGNNSTKCTSAAEDGINDTPQQGEESDATQIPSPPATQNTCFAGTANDLPDLWENYMDYSYDKAQTMFTKGQVEFMRKICENQRDTLVNQTAPTGINDLTVHDDLFKVYPQPAGSGLYLTFPGKVDELNLISLLGVNVMKIKNIGTSGSYKMNVENITSGHYILSISQDGRRINKHIIITH